MVVYRRGDVSVDVRINQRAIDRFVMPGGDVYEWTEGVLKNARRSARRRAPVATGDLAAGIESEIENTGPNTVTGSLGTDGVAHALFYLLGHGPQGGKRNRPIGATQVRRGMASGQVNRRPGRRYGGKPTLFTNGPIAGFRGNNILADALAEAFSLAGLIVTPETFKWE